MIYRGNRCCPRVRHANLDVPVLKLGRHDCLGELLCLATGVKRRQGPFPLSAEAISKRRCSGKLPSDGRLRSGMNASNPDGTRTAVHRLHASCTTAIFQVEGLQSTSCGRPRRERRVRSSKTTRFRPGVAQKEAVPRSGRANQRKCATSFVRLSGTLRAVPPFTARRHA